MVAVGEKHTGLPGMRKPHVETYRAARLERGGTCLQLGVRAVENEGPRQCRAAGVNIAHGRDDRRREHAPVIRREVSRKLVLHQHGSGVLVALDTWHSRAAQPDDPLPRGQQLHLAGIALEHGGSQPLRGEIVVVVPRVPRGSVEPAPVHLGVGDRRTKLLLESHRA